MIVKGRRVTEGSATGKVALSTAPLSFLGEIDPNTGNVDNPQSELNGQSVRGQVLVFPQARGSTVGPYVLYGAGKRGVGPCALVVQEADAIVASAAVIARIPCVDEVDIDLFLPGEEITVHGSRGEVEIPGVTATEVVTALIQDAEGRVLLLQRSEKVGSFQGRWAGVSGYLEAPTALEQAYQEISEETGITKEQLELLRKGPPVYTRDGPHGFIVHPFLFRTSVRSPKLDWEHVAFEWVTPREIAKRPTVPKLARVWDVLSRPEAEPPSAAA